MDAVCLYCDGALAAGAARVRFGDGSTEGEGHEERYVVQSAMLCARCSSLFPRWKATMEEEGWMVFSQSVIETIRSRELAFALEKVGRLQKDGTEVPANLARWVEALQGETWVPRLQVSDAALAAIVNSTEDHRGRMGRAYVVLDTSAGMFLYFPFAKQGKVLAPAR